MDNMDSLVKRINIRITDKEQFFDLDYLDGSFERVDGHAFYQRCMESLGIEKMEEHCENQASAELTLNRGVFDKCFRLGMYFGVSLFMLIHSILRAI